MEFTGTMNQINHSNNTSAIRQKGESQNGCYKKTKHAKFSEKRTFLTPLRTRVRTFKTFTFYLHSDNDQLVFAIVPFFSDLSEHSELKRSKPERLDEVSFITSSISAIRSINIDSPISETNCLCIVHLASYTRL